MSRCYKGCVACKILPVFELAGGCFWPLFHEIGVSLPQLVYNGITDCHRLV